MKKFIIKITATLTILSLLLLFLRTLFLYYTREHTAPIPQAKNGSIRIACVGDSITYGTLVKHRTRNCYPTQLEQLLGEGYSVGNFGINGHTMLRSGDFPYWEHKNFQLSSEYLPDIVLIMLGTNDSKAKNWTTTEEYIKDYRSMIAHYQSLSSHPTIFVMTPPKEFIIKDHTCEKYDMDNSIILEINQALKDMALEDGLTLIDIYAATKDHPECFSYDGIHPDAAGDSIIAQTVYHALYKEKPQ